MALQSVQMNSPKQPDHFNDTKPVTWMDKLLTGLQIAQGVSGIYNNVESGINKSADTTKIKLETAQRAEGISGPLETFAAQGGRTVPEGTPGSVILKQANGVDEDGNPLSKAINVMGKEAPAKDNSITPYQQAQLDLGKTRNDTTSSHFKAMEGLAATADERKLATEDRKTGKTFEDNLNPNKSRNGEILRQQGKINNGNAALGVLENEDGTPKPLTKGKATEAGIAVANLVGGSAAAQHTIDQLTPSSLAGDVKAQWGYLTNTLQPQEMDQVVNDLRATAHREISIAQQNIKNAQIEIVGSNTAHEYRQRNPEGWTRSVRAAGLNPDDFDEESRFAPKQKPAGTAASAGANSVSSSGAATPKLIQDSKDPTKGTIDGKPYKRFKNGWIPDVAPTGGQ